MLFLWHYSQYVGKGKYQRKKIRVRCYFVELVLTDVAFAYLIHYPQIIYCLTVAT